LYILQYLGELSLLDAERFLHFLPSELGAASTALARHTLGLEPWPESLQKLTGLTLEQLYPCLRPLTNTFVEAETYPQQAVHEKFTASK
jgi:cyclin A